MDSSGHPPGKPGGPSDTSHSQAKTTVNTNKTSSTNMERTQQLCENYIQRKPCRKYGGKCKYIHDNIKRAEWEQSDAGRKAMAERAQEHKNSRASHEDTKGLAASAFAPPQASDPSVTPSSVATSENIKPKTSKPETAGAAMNKPPANDRARPQRAAATFGPMASSALSNIHKHLDIAPKDKKQMISTKPATREGSVKSSSDTQSNFSEGRRTQNTQQKTQSMRATGVKPSGNIKKDTSTLADNRSKQEAERNMPFDSGRSTQGAAEYRGLNINKSMSKSEMQASRAVDTRYYPDSAPLGQAMHDVWRQHGGASATTRNGAGLDFLRGNKEAFATNQVPSASRNSSLPRYAAPMPLKDLAASKPFGDKLDFALSDKFSGVKVSSVAVDDKTGIVRINVYIPPSAMSHMLAKSMDGSGNLDIAIPSSDLKLSGAGAAAAHTSAEHGMQGKMNSLPLDTRSITERIKASKENGSCQLFLKGFPCKFKACKFYHDVALRDANMANICPDNLRGMACQNMKSCYAWHKPLESLSAVATERYVPERRQPEVSSPAQTEFSQRSTRIANIETKKEHQTILNTGDKSSTKSSSIDDSKVKTQLCSLYLRGCCDFGKEGAMKHPSTVTQGIIYIHDVRMFQEFQRISRADKSLCRNFLAGAKCAASPCTYKHKDEARRQLLAVAKGKPELPGNSEPEIDPDQICEPFAVSGRCRQGSCPHSHDVFMQNQLRSIGTSLCKKFLIDAKCDGKCLRAHNKVVRGRLWDAWAVANGMINESDLESPVRAPGHLEKDRLASASFAVDNSKSFSAMPAPKPQGGRVPQTSKVDARTMAPQWGIDKLTSPADFATYLGEKYPKKGAARKDDEQPARPDADKAINKEEAVNADGFPILAAAVPEQSVESKAAQSGKTTTKTDTPKGGDVVKAHVNDSKEGVDLETKSDVSDESTILIHDAVDLGRDEPNDISEVKRTEEVTSSRKEVSNVSPELVQLPASSESDDEEYPNFYSKYDVAGISSAKAKADGKGTYVPMLKSSEAVTRSPKNYGSLGFRASKD